MGTLLQLTEVANELTALKEKIRKEADSLVRSVLQSFISMHPGIRTIWWVQYTPYFNDGEPCIFRVGDLNFSTIDYEEGTVPDYPEDDFTFDEYALGKEKEIVKLGATLNLDIMTLRDCKELSRGLGALGEELQYVFGDHTKIIVNSNGITAEEYEHD